MLVRIAYFVHVNGGSRSGVFHKIAGQIHHWREAGHVVQALVLTRDDASAWQIRLGDAVVKQYDGIGSRMRAMLSLVHAATAFRPDILYRRYDIFYPQELAFPRRAVQVVEVNTNDLGEYALGTRGRFIYNARTRSLTLGRARGLVFVTTELSEDPSFRGYRAIHRVITNGIDLDSYPELSAPSNDRPRLVFVGSASQPWHGVDKLVALAMLRPAWAFDIVGMDGTGHPAASNVSWHGSLGRNGVLDILSRADVGVGTLALHRKAMHEACALKNREYLAVGLPVLYAGRDLDLDGLGEYVLRIANTETGVIDDLGRIDQFVGRSIGLRVSRSRVQHIDVAQKEQQRMALFQELIRS
jgi:glycosyltransferase involved in cell wall biosynthesis